MAIRDKLIAKIKSAKWNALTAADLDSEFVKLTADEKLLIVKSIVAGNDEARTLIRRKFDEHISPIAAAEADQYLASGNVPIDVLDSIF